jgi:hypothetical protein
VGDAVALGNIFGAPIDGVRFATDSPVEGDGFELSVPRRGDGCRHPVRPLQDKRRMLEHAGGTADREIALLTGGYGMSRVVRLI